jgi:hypothetical protein
MKSQHGLGLKKGGRVLIAEAGARQASAKEERDRIEGDEEEQVETRTTRRLEQKART